MKHNAHVTYFMSADTLSPVTNMYAPYYRQLSAVGIVKNPTPDKFMETVSSNVTRTDVYAALDYYFENCNNGRPFILAGHSQGSCNLKIVLSEYMRLHPEYLERMVACYAIGFYFPDSWFEANPHIKKAEGENDTGVLITWNTEGPDATMFNLPIGNNDGFCINPLNWKTDETPADISMNKGTVFVDGDVLTDVFNIVSQRKVRRKFALVGADEIAKEYEKGAADARIDKKRGALITTEYTDYIPVNDIFGDKSCHFEDWSLYTMNIRENAMNRINAFLKERIKKDN